MPTGLSSNKDKITAKDRKVLVGPAPDGDGAGAPTPGPDVDTDTLGDLTPTKGNLVVGNGSAWAVLPVSGNDDYVLIEDSAEVLGMRWGPVVVPTPASAFDERDLWLYGEWDPDLKDLTDPDLDLWMFGDN
jgi:hypothetical protein